MVHEERLACRAGYPLRPDEGSEFNVYPLEDVCIKRTRGFAVHNFLERVAWNRGAERNKPRRTVVTGGLGSS